MNHVPQIRLLEKTNLQQDYHHSILISVLRGLAALQVVAAHLRAQLYPGLITIADPTMWYQGLAFFTGFAHQAVVVFFVLSGWLVGGSLLNKLGEPQILLSYAIDRMTRLWIVLTPAFAATLMLGMFTGAVDPSRIDYSSANDYSVSSFVGNLLGLQDLAVPRYGGNFALWSLTYESWYYVLFPLVLLLFIGKTVLAKGAAALATAFIAYHLNAGILLYFSVWLLGAAFSRVHIALTALARLALIALFAAVAVYFRLLGSNNILLEDSFLQDLLYSIIFLIILSSLQSRANLAAPGTRLCSRLGKFFSEFSFSLYVIHVPLLVALRQANAQLNGADRLSPDKPGDFAVYLAMLVMIVLIAYLFHLPFEAQTYRVRRRIKQFLLPGPQPQNIA
jgi:peptidoglycan/LPS O-acetylase OafA/YrhL